MNSAITNPNKANTSPGLLRRLFGRGFYLLMSIACLVIVIIGFAPKVDAKLIHANYPVPFALWVHSAVFTGWTLLFIAQAWLVRAGNVAAHRRLGFATAGAGILVPIVGSWVAIVMGSLRVSQGRTSEISFVLIPLVEMAQFACLFWMAYAWRRRPDIHRRLMLLATIVLLGAAFARFPRWIVPGRHFDVATDFLIGLVLVRDLGINRRIHRVYLIAFPALVVLQLITDWASGTETWMDISRTLLK
jgi:hypothetical protein